MQGHVETAPLFTVPCEGREARFLNRSLGRRVAVHNITAAQYRKYTFACVMKQTDFTTYHYLLFAVFLDFYSAATLECHPGLLQSTDAG